ncbi:hypothetical protein LAZ67_2004016 [Cordylochernes scorpioides]|uniref:Uncharacterized protein n=1 Tax=Cordylochernes scorpioides TaxID=51811 RepID=A0ABY6K832_9ARAC|nr:hypothetical protein LAZ67_2004016 [Cordylochernes scorpioides]
MHDPHHNSAPAIHRNICSLPFCPQSITIARFLRQHGITTYFQNPPNIATLIRHPITRSSLHASSLRSGGAVYSVSCDQCNATYVGETDEMVTRMRWKLVTFKITLLVPQVRSASVSMELPLVNVSTCELRSVIRFFTAKN